jgi:hypothetical protein
MIIRSQEGARLVVVGGFDHTEQKIPIPVLSTLSTDQPVVKIQDILKDLEPIPLNSRGVFVVDNVGGGIFQEEPLASYQEA